MSAAEDSDRPHIRQEAKAEGNSSVIQAGGDLIYHSCVPGTSHDDVRRGDGTAHLKRGRRHMGTWVVVVVVVMLAAGIVFALFLWDKGHSSNGSSVGDPDKADPCSLLEAKVLARFGDTRMDTNYGEFDRCDLLVQKGDEDVVDVDLNFASDAVEPDSVERTEKVGSVIVTAIRGDADECVKNLRLADGNHIWITAKEIGSPVPDLCQVAQAVTDHAVAELNQGPVRQRPEPFHANSLARLDACELLDAAALSMVPGIDAQDPDRDFADWGCGWESTTAHAGVELSFSRDNDLTDNGRRTRLGGRRSYVAPKDRGEHTCVVHVEHRDYTDGAGESAIEHVTLNAYGPQSYTKLCHTAKALATAIAKKLPRP